MNRTSLEWLTKPINASGADDGAGKGEQRKVRIKTRLETDTELAKNSQSGMSALDHPAMPAQTFGALDPAPGNTRRDVPLAQMLAAAFKVIPLVGMEFIRTSPRSATTPRNRGQRIHQRLEDDGVMPVGAGDAVSNGLCNRYHRPLACQSRRRRQQVMPLPKPSPCDRSAQKLNPTGTENACFNGRFKFTNKCSRSNDSCVPQERQVATHECVQGHIVERGKNVIDLRPKE